MFDQPPQDQQPGSPAPAAGEGVEQDQRLPNLDKLYRVPRFAVRQLLHSRTPGRSPAPRSQAELVEEADRSPAITAADVEALYETYRYGQRLAFYLYLLPQGLDQPHMEAIQAALGAHRAADLGSTAGGVVLNDDYEAEVPPEQVLLLDQEKLNGIHEFRFRYYVGHRFLNADEQPEQVLQARYGFLWLDLALGYLAILTRDERVSPLLIRALSGCLGAIPLPVRFSKELVDKHFSIEKAKRLSHYDPGTGVRQSISGDGLWKRFEQELVAREQQYVLPSSLYEEEIVDGVTSGLGVTASKGQIYLTRALPTSLLRAWGRQRLPDLVRDVRSSNGSQPGSFEGSMEVIERMRLPAAGRAAIVAIAEALLRADREELTSVPLLQTAPALYKALAGKYFSPYLRVPCGECEEMGDLCPRCESQSLEFVQDTVRCKKCGAVASDGETVVLRCMNGHTTEAPLAEALGIAPNHWLQKRLVQLFAELDRAWSEQADYFYIQGSTLHRLRKGQLGAQPLPPVVQNFVKNHFWDKVSAVHTGSGDQVSGPGAPAELRAARPPQRTAQGESLPTYKSFDLRLRANGGEGYTVEAALPEDGSVPPQPLSLPQDGLFQHRLRRVFRQTTNSEDIRSVGQALFNALFPPRITRLWAGAIGGLQEGTGLRIRLHIDPAELMTLPWELIYDEDYLGLQLRFPVVRTLDLPSSPRLLTVEPPLRVLIATAEPKDASPLNTALELDGIRATLAPLTASSQVEVDVLASARRDELLSRLRRGYQVLHFVGHGTFGRGEGYLLLEDAGGRADPVSASLLGQMVTDSSLRLVVLNACETAVTGAEAPFGGLAHQLVRAGMPAVVAMQMAIAEPTAYAFSREFYGALADGWPVEAAVQQGRRSIMTALGNDWSQRVDWATPTLYMRASEGSVLAPG